MAVTIITSPSAKQAAYRPIIFETTSSRISSLVYSVTAVSAGAGTTSRLAISSPAVVVGDTVTLSGFTTLAYNRRCAVTVVSGAYIEVDIDFTVNDSGTVTRTNDNFNMRGDCYVFDQTRFAITGVTNPGGGFIEVTTTGAHGYSFGSIVLLRGTANYDGVYTVILSLTSTTFYVVAAYVATNTGTVQKGTLTGTKRQAIIVVGTTPTFRFTFSNILQSALSYNIYNFPSTVQSPTQESIKAYCVLFTEEFDDADGIVKSASALMSLQKFALNATLQFDETQNLNDYILSGSSSKFLTDAPRNQSIRINEEYQLSFIGVPGVTYLMKWERFDFNNASLGVSTGSAFTIIDDRATFSVNNGNALSSSCAYVDVWVNQSSTQKSEKFRFQMTTKTAPIYRRFFWLNRKGGIDAYTFTGQYTCKRSRKSTDFTKTLPLNFTITDVGNQKLSVDPLQKHSIVSDMLPSDTCDWLQSLNDSPVVFLREAEGSASFIPVIPIDDEQPTQDTAGSPLYVSINYYKPDIILQTN